ncbi:hypothetical protein [Rhizobium sp. SSA_523]|uniref:hypothetical protein n=1 Tax=Rhizobium sp. SSA_523 TaxID=2952477 RepID=UPI002091A11C|nr:hypothetical protein [Rhizobium sp. SSA_523]MCO5730295.1 hypothetical protein [Rhizobium sp. SSA_523]WKC25348.1 hypothetical protein QTJ18_15350 [Rhizobium sp. SSA_523]
MNSRKQVLVRNERAKLSAAAIDRLSTACVVVGFITPLVSLSGTTTIPFWSLSLIFSTVNWLLAALILHLMVRYVLKRLEP